MRAPAADLPIVFERVAYVADDVRVLGSIDLVLEAGAPTVVIGPNGAGKTTLLRLAAGLLQPSGGRLTWGGREHAPHDRRAIVFQRPVMLRRSTEANLRYALATVGVAGAERAARTRHLLAQVGLADLAKRPARKLSGGEQQRLALARGLARNPQVLFLDEPTAGLDPAAGKSVEEIIRQVAAQGIKVVMTTHELGTARRLAGEAVLLHRGRIVERGEAAAFFSRPQTPEAAKFLAGDLLI